MQRQSDRIESTIRDMQQVRGSSSHRTKYKAAIFFDNDADYIADVKRECPHIKGVKVHANDKIEYLQFKHKALQHHINTLHPGNTYVNSMTEQGIKSDLYDPTGGFNVGIDGKTLRNWIAATRLRPAAALFDWDQTLSKFGSIATESLTVSDNEHTLEYLLGGKQRLSGLRALFAQLGRAGIHVIILTNNGAAVEQSYLDMINTLMPAEVADLFVIYAGGAPYHGNKGKTLRDMEEFSEMCVPRRKKLTRRLMRQRRLQRLPRTKRLRKH
jgi:hypothetical protein